MNPHDSECLVVRVTVNSVNYPHQTVIFINEKHLLNKDEIVHELCEQMLESLKEPVKINMTIESDMRTYLAYDYFMANLKSKPDLVKQL